MMKQFRKIMLSVLILIWITGCTATEGAEESVIQEDESTAISQPTAVTGTAVSEPTVENVFAALSLAERNDALLDAVRNDDATVVSQLLALEVDMNTADPAAGLTALSMAAARANMEMVQLLLDAGADVEHVDNMGLTALGTAVARDDVQLVQLLLDAGADAAIVDNNGNNLLHHAVDTGNEQLVTLILEQEAVVRTLAHKAASKFQPKCPSYFVNVDHGKLLFQHPLIFFMFANPKPYNRIILQYT